ncbi:MAG: hypothetical protein Q8O37_07960 [Sulfuricellaceae bacterium]|nr:hypothetical protein [Sulfuricellaceae bacterium]
MAIRVRSQWHTTGEAKSPQQVATVVASLIFRVAEEKVTHMQQADFQISSKEQGFAIISEYLAFLLQYTDRFIYGRVEEEYRAALIGAIAKRIAEILEDNQLTYIGQPEGTSYQSRFITLLNERLAEYAGFDYENGEPGYPCRRFLGSMIIGLMPKQDQSWTIDQVVEIEVPNALELLRRGLSGLFSEESGTFG